MRVARRRFLKFFDEGVLFVVICCGKSFGYLIRVLL
jgi:hypothetical protein